MSWLADGWAWLDANGKQIGALSSIAFGLSSAAVAWFAYILNRRNNVGSVPMVFVHDWSVSGGPDKPCTGHFKVEFWNRRKYPVIMRSVRIELQDTVFTGKDYNYSKGWVVKDGRLGLILSESAEPSVRKGFEVAGPISDSWVKVIKRGSADFVGARVRYIDPWQERAIEVRSDGFGDRVVLRAAQAGAQAGVRIGIDGGTRAHGEAWVHQARAQVRSGVRQRPEHLPPRRPDRGRHALRGREGQVHGQ